MDRIMINKVRLVYFLVFLLSFEIVFAQRPLKPNDLLKIRNVSDPSISPEGTWIVYAVSSVDSVKDKRNSDIWMSSFDGTGHVQLTFSSDGEYSPRFSPDGKYISFLSARGNLDHAQIWLIDRRGGEAKKITNLKSDITGYEWSPDSKQLLLTIRDIERADSLKQKPRNPIVIENTHFKQDVEGYKLPLHKHLYLFNISNQKLDTLTSGNYDENAPAWSPDGSKIAFSSNRTSEPDRNSNMDIWVINAKKGEQPKRITDWKGSDDYPKWSPDGKVIAYISSSGSGNFLMYEQSILNTISVDGGAPVQHTISLDRDISQHSWTTDGTKVSFIVSDDRQEYAASIDIATNKLHVINRGNYEFVNLKPVQTGQFIAIANFPNRPDEIYAIENGQLRRITNHQDEFVKGITFSIPTGFSSRSKDGAIVSNLLFLPPGMKEGKKLPTIFFIHGGPVAQDTYGFDLSRQMLAAEGYAVCAVNYRGSNGRGLTFTKAIYGDWGNKEVLDIFGATDELVRNGIADPDRLAIAGWSYGGILTNYCIATDPTRFKAAVSGAGSSLQLTMFGTDQYINQYENELGYPWDNPEKYLKLSYPFMKANRIKTPTLFMVGEKDFNVPAAGSEQMYQALKVLHIPTQLVVYPEQFHGISVPSYQMDRFNRHFAWFKKYLNEGLPATQIKPAR
jgi:dipeptidyl aminopeptidase/acylaminoacyl peptidase